MLRLSRNTHVWPLLFYLFSLVSARLVAGLSLTPRKRIGGLTDEYGNSAEQGDQSQYTFADLGLKQEEYSVIFSGSRALWSSHSQADCFRLVAAQVKGLCGHRMDSDQDAKVRAAIALTRCELATARLRTPLECDAIHTEGTGAHHYSDRSTYESSRRTSSCVEALSRSTQFWATYSGYMRELPQLCFALSKVADEDVAKQIYRNVTREKQALLRVLRTHLEESEKKSEKERHERQRHRRALQDLYDSFEKALQDKTAVEHVIQTVQHETASLSSILVSQLNHTAAVMHGDIAVSLSSQLHGLVSSLSQHNREVVAAEVRHGVERVVSQHEDKLAPLLQVHLPDLVRRLSMAGDELTLAAHQSSSRIEELHEEMRLAHTTALSMASSNAQTGQSVRDIQGSLSSLVRSTDESATHVNDVVSALGHRISHLEELLQTDIEQRRELQERHRQYLVESQRVSLTSIARRVLGFNTLNTSVNEAMYPASIGLVPGPTAQQMMLVWMQRRALELLPTVFTTQFGHFLLLMLLAGGKMTWFLVSHLAAAVFIALALTWRAFGPLRARLQVWMSRPRMHTSEHADLPLHLTSRPGAARRLHGVSHWRSDIHNESSEEEVEELLTMASPSSEQDAYRTQSSHLSRFPSSDEPRIQSHDLQMQRRIIKVDAGFE